MMPIALQQGISIEDYMNHSFYELELIIEAKREIEERKVKASLMQDYQMTDLMSVSIARLLDSKTKFPKIFEIYPDIFGEEFKEYMEAKEAEIEAQRLSAQWAMYVEKYNASLKKED